MKLSQVQIRNIDIIKQEAENYFASDFSGHDFQHTLRVYENALILNKAEGGNTYIIALAALLHDFDDKKLSPETVGTKENAINALRKITDDSELVAQVIDIISCVSFSEGKIPVSLEGKIVQDADRLDAIGAVGIVRCFSYGASKRRPAYCDRDFTSDMKQGCESGVAHFYEKLLKIYDKMLTVSGKKLAEERTAYMLDFLSQLKKEINGEQLP